MYQRHCLESGGCPAKGHETLATLPSDKGKQCAVSPSFSLSKSPPPELLMASTSASEAMDMFANPQHASQLTSVFTKYHAVKQAQEEHQQVLDAKRLANIEKGKHQVIIYSWPKVFGFFIVFFWS